MADITENIANNIQKLRKIKGWKQIDLANKLNYTDKTISKWERGESVPDIRMLADIAVLFNVSIDYLTKDHSYRELEYAQKDSQLFVRNLLITILYCVAVYFVATILFVTALIREPSAVQKWWVVFIIAIPICSWIVAMYGKRCHYWLVSLISLSVLIWSSITAIFCITIILELNNFFWLLYLIGIPLQAAVCLYFFWKRNTSI